MKLVKLMAVLVAVVTTLANAADGTKVGGFVDAQYQWVKDGRSTGFVVNDGAVYLMGDMGMCSATVDIPFAADTRDTVTATRVGGANFSIAQNKAQAFVHHKYDNGISWQIGQFDTPFGYEGNDTKDVAMSSVGTLKAQLIPVVHAGATVGYETGSIKANVLVANQRENNVNRAGTNGEFGAHVTAGFDDISVAAGILIGKSGDTSTKLIDAVLKYSAGKMNFGGEFTINSAAETAMGIGVFAGMEMTDRVGFDLRFNYTSKAVALIDSGMQIAAGPSFNMSKAMKTKVHYTFTSSTPTTGDKTTSHGAAIASVYSF